MHQRLPLTDPASLPSATGGYPWRITDSSATVVYLKNTTTVSQQYVLQLTQQVGEAYTSGVRTIAAGETVTVDMKQLRDTQEPDARGTRLSARARAGQVHWSILGPERLGIIGRAEDMDTEHGVSSTYACANCCPDSYGASWLSPSSNVDFIGGHSEIVARQRNVDCYGSSLAAFQPSGVSWSSANTRIATINGSGRTTGQGGGRTTLQGQWTVYDFAAVTVPTPMCVLFTFTAAPTTQVTVQRPSSLVEYKKPAYEYKQLGYYLRKYFYEVRDQDGEPIRQVGIEMSEAIQMGTDGCSIGTPPPGAPANTNSQGRFGDLVGVRRKIAKCDSAPACTSTVNQWWYANDVEVRRNLITFSCEGVHIQQK